MKLSFFEPHRDFPEIYRWVLNRPAKLNALSGDLVESLIQDLNELRLAAESLKCRVLLVESAAAPKAFCAGADLTERMSMNESQVSETLKKLRGLMSAVESLPCPTIAVVDGIAFGGGLELSLSCDFRVASPESKMGLTELKLGIIPGAGGTQRLSRLIGLARAKEIIFSSQIVDAPRAYELGILSRVGENPSGLALEMAQSFVGAAPLALVAAKLAIGRALEGDLERGLDHERNCYEKVLKSQDRIEGLKAFLEKRKAVFQGK